MNRQSWRRNLLSLTLGLLAVLVVGGSLVSSYQRINQPFPGFFLYQNMSVGPDFLPHWSGARGGVTFLDRVVALDDRPVSAPGEIYDTVRKNPPGTQFRYRLERAGEESQAVVQSMTFSLHDWLLSFGVYLLTAVGFLVIGVAPIYLRSPSPSAPALCFMASMIFIWFATTYDFLITQTLPKEIRAFAFLLTPSAGLHLGLLLTGGRTRGWKHRLYVGLAYGVSLVLGLFYSLTFEGPAELWLWALKSSYGYSLIGAVGFLLLLGSGLRTRESQLERSRLRVVFMGGVAGFFLPTLGAVSRAFLGWEIPHNFLLILAVFFPLSVAYALLKYNLFDLGVVLKVSLSRGALTGVLLLVYVVVVSILSLAAGVYESGVLTPLFFAVLVVIIFNPLLRWLEGAVDRYVYGQDYNPMRLQSDLSALLRSLDRPELAAERFLRLVANRLGIEAAYLFFRPAEGAPPVTASLNGWPGGGRPDSVDLVSWWIGCFGRRGQGVSKSEVESDPAYLESREPTMELCRRLRAELLIPIMFANDVLGLVCFGRKRSGREYSAGDFYLLSSLADQLALSLKNGVLYEESEKAKESYRTLYDEAQVLNQRLLEADRLKKEFVANISHELRTPISTILGYSEVLLDPAFRGDPQAVLERLVSSGQSLSLLMDNLTDFARMEAETLAIAPEEVNLTEILESLEIMTRRLIKERPIDFRFRLDDSPVRIRTERKKMQQILMHLLTNALKFTERGEISIRVQALAEGPDTVVEISVADTGIGISQKDQEAIFDDFRQLDGSSTRKYGGTGLGLSLCRKLAQSLGGKITVASEVGRGSIFSLILPLHGASSMVVGQ
jgi:signal transduction histidine kinase